MGLRDQMGLRDRRVVQDLPDLRVQFPHLQFIRVQPLIRRDVVLYAGGTYIANTSAFGDDPDTSSRWTLFASPGRMLIVAEWNDQYYTSSLRNGWRWSFGAGMNNVDNTDSSTNPVGTVLPIACRLKKIEWFVGNVGAETGSTSFTHKITKNGTDLATTYSWASTGSGGNSYLRSASPDVDFAAGDTFNLRVTSPSGYSSTRQIGRLRATFYFEVREN